jgi:UDP-N-acetyl-D-glucosamine dehydrogenase
VRRAEAVSPKEALIEKLKSRKAVVAVIGMGYVGLPLTLRFCEERFRVIGLDIDGEKVARLNRGESYIEHIRPEAITAARQNGFTATTDFARIRDCDAIVICVPTPLNRYREPDLSFIVGTTDALVPHLRRGQVVSLESTSYPGTTEEVVRPRLETSGLKVGEEIFLVYSPEREDPGNRDYSTRSIPKVCAGTTPACLEVGKALYGEIIETVVPVSSTRTAEMTKLLENIHRAVNIGLANEMKIIADRMGIDIHEVIRAAATKPFGFVPYYPGPGLGGHCIPVDPFYLTWKAREYGLHTRFIELAGEINRTMPEWVVGKIADALNERGRPLRGSKILVLGVAYKKNVDDMRESPAVALMELLRAKGAELAYSDPHVPVFPRMREHRFDLRSVALTPETLGSQDCVVIATDHDAFDFDGIRRHARLVVDTRGVYADSFPNVVKA